MKKQNGITLIALVITIIVLLILAGVSISLVIGDNGILTQATQAVKDNRKAVAIEDVSIAWAATESGYLKEWTKNTSVNKEEYVKKNLPEHLKNTGAVMDITEDGIINDDDIQYDNDNGTKLKYQPNGDNRSYVLKIDKNGKVEIDTGENTGSTENTEENLNHDEAIAEDATFERYNPETDKMEEYDGKNFPDELLDCDEYWYNDYQYLYQESLDSWIVAHWNGTTDTCGLVLKSIAGKEVSMMSLTFSDCTNLKKLPEGFEIPNTVSDINGLFYGCTGLESLPEGFTIPDSVSDITEMFNGCSSLVSLPDSFVIPESVTNMNYTFAGCTSLTGNIRVNANPESFDSCFDGVNPDNIEITGDCSQETKDALLETAVVY